MTCNATPAGSAPRNPVPDPPPHDVGGRGLAGSILRLTFGGASDDGREPAPHSQAAAAAAVRLGLVPVRPLASKYLLAQVRCRSS